jgi:hypothetical protein
MRFLLVLMSLVFSANAIAAEKCKSADGREMYCFEHDVAREMLKIIDVEVPSLKRTIAKQQSQIKAQEELMKIKDEKFKVQEDITNKWKDNFENLSTQIAAMNDDERVESYIDVGIFLLGTLVGGSIMYTSSLLVSNTIN